MVGTIVLAVLWCVSGWMFNRVAKRFRSDILSLGRENLTLAKAVKKLQERCEQAETDAKATLEIAMDCQAVYKDHENRLTTIEGQPKIDVRAKPRTVPFRQFKAAAESLPEED